VALGRAEVRGLKGTKTETILELLPRSLPATYTHAELGEFERRVRNLSLFDLVSVMAQDGVLLGEVREKVTVAPILSFSSGKTVKDLS
jgi:outer membrane protein assembly factor BamA